MFSGYEVNQAGVDQLWACTAGVRVGMRRGKISLRGRGAEIRLCFEFGAGPKLWGQENQRKGAWAAARGSGLCWGQ